MSLNAFFCFRPRYNDCQDIEKRRKALASKHELLQPVALSVSRSLQGSHYA